MGCSYTPPGCSSTPAIVPLSQQTLSPARGKGGIRAEGHAATQSLQRAQRGATGSGEPWEPSRVQPHHPRHPQGLLQRALQATSGDIEPNTGPDTSPTRTVQDEHPPGAINRQPQRN
jgi:hypothetical protein